MNPNQKTVTHGRPPKSDDKKRKFVIQSKLTRDEYDSVVAAAEAAGLSTYEYMRRAVLSERNVATLRPEDWALFKGFVEELRRLEASMSAVINRCDESISKISAVEMLSFLTDITALKADYLDRLKK